MFAWDNSKCTKHNCEGSPDKQSNISFLPCSHPCMYMHTHRGPKDYTRPVNFVLSEKRLNDNEEEEEEGDVDSDLDDEVSCY